MDVELSLKVDQWLKWDANGDTKSEIVRLRDDQDIVTLKQLLCKRMEFGTAGLRARMGAGFSQMNDLTIIQTTQGLLNYASSQFLKTEQRKIVVGYDARYNSSKWAKYISNIFQRAGWKVFLFPECYPTPMVAFGVRHFKASLGVIITASHNPKEDNGYKVYWSNGSQIISPHDKGIADSINACLEPQDSSWDISSVKCSIQLPEFMRVYCEEQKKALCFTPDANKKCPVKMVYTPMHGVGWKAVKLITEEFGFQTPLPVPEQIEPDPEMRTVKYPNPEEGKSALDLSFVTAEKAGSPIVLANDPDADRLAVAEKQPDGKWKIFTGNQLGAMFASWIWSNWRKRNPTADASKVSMISSTVSSKILQTMAQKEKFQFAETLTGFKWMGNRAEAWAKEGIQTLFAFEEAIGFMCGDIVLDKDGVSALAVMSELINDVYSKKSSLQNYLTDIYKKYGYHLNNNGYYFCHEPEKITTMFHRIRHWPNDPSERGYPKSVGRFGIKGIRDLTTGFDDEFPDKKPRLPVSKSSQCITFTFHNGVSLTIRTSGTEPKIKYYSELRSDPTDKRSEESLFAELQELIDAMVEAFYEPKKNGFRAPNP